MIDDNNPATAEADIISPADAAAVLPDGAAKSFEITVRARDQIRRGVLWIFSNEIQFPSPLPQKGEWGHFVCKGQWVAAGYVNPHSLIAGRVITAKTQESLTALLEARLRRAFELRKEILKQGCARLVFSEGDFLPGLIIDAYGDVAVIQSNTAGIDTIMDDLSELVPAAFQQVFGRELKGLVIRADGGIRQLEGVENFVRVVRGDEAALRNAVLEENGTLYAADFVDGQKTGFFLDQKDNRSFLRGILPKWKHARVLDLCSYSGGWGLAALKSGAGQVTFVDESAAALDLVKRGLELNGIPEHKVVLEKRDLFRYLENGNDRFDVVVADPPAFVKSKKVLPQAVRAYEKMIRLSWNRVAKGGMLIACSCSHHIPEAGFEDIVRSAIMKENGVAHMVYRGGQSSDHPILLSMPETRYLKSFGLLKSQL